jgi:hypothetical protein
MTAASSRFRGFVTSLGPPDRQPGPALSIDGPRDVSRSRKKTAPRPAQTRERGGAGTATADPPLAAWSRPRWSSVAVSLALVAGLVVIVATYRDYGITWDEDVQARYGDMVLDYFLSGFEDRAYRDFHDLRFYGPTFEVLPAMVARATGAPLYETRHFLNALTGLLTLLAVVRLARQAGDEWAVVFSGLAFVSFPGSTATPSTTRKTFPSRAGSPGRWRASSPWPRRNGERSAGSASPASRSVWPCRCGRVASCCWHLPPSVSPAAGSSHGARSIFARGRSRSCSRC